MHHKDIKLAILLSTSNSETNWNALRLANFSLQQGDEIQIFLLGEGLEYEKNSSTKFAVSEQVKIFMESEKETLFACGTRLKS